VSRAYAGGAHHVLQVFQPPSGGVPAYVAVLVKDLLARGWRVSVALSDLARVGPELRRAGADVIPLRLSRSPNPFQDPRAVRCLVSLCRRGQVDLIHAHSSKAGALVGVAGRLANVPSVYTPHGWSFQMHAPAWVLYVFAGIERVLVSHCHQFVIAVGEEERALGVGWRVVRPESVRVIPTALWDQTPRYTRVGARELLGLPRNGLVAAWIGRNAPQKRPQDLAPLAEGLRRGGVILIALGEGLAGSPEGARLIGSGGVLASSSIDPEIIYAAGDLFVQTSEWEGSPLTILEAMRAGLPVVAYGVGGIREQVEDGGTGALTVSGDIAGLVRNVCNLATAPGRLRDMGEAGRARFVERFRRGSMLDAIEEAYVGAMSQYGRDGKRRWRGTALANREGQR
jgi:glycosyltransferase involved in cell wall biosynthesis